MGLKYLLIIVTFLFSFLSMTEDVFAVKAPKCKDAKPATAPVITQAIPGNGNVKLIWTEGADPITHYLLEYGPSKEQMIYGAQNIGPKGTTSYTVEGLANGTKYYFRVHAINNCSHKDSHTISATAGGETKTQSTGTDLPRLSFFKTDSATVSSFTQEHSKGAAVPVAMQNGITECKNGCYGAQLLILELMCLLLFFYISYKYPVVKPIYALIIPLFFAVVFYLFNQKCVANGFFCNYFYVLNATLFILGITLQRQRLISKTMEK